MKDILVMENCVFFDILKSEQSELSEFISIVEMLKKSSYKIILSNEVYLEEIYEELYKKSKYNEDIKLISIVFERVFNCIDNMEYEKIITEINDIIKNESSSFEKILANNETFDHMVKKVGFKLNINSGIRNISSLIELKEVLLLFCKGKNNINEFINEIKNILNEVVFDDNIVESIEKLSDGFDLRKNEIIYHLYVIENEIPSILKSNPSGYIDIGSQMSIDCSPERNRTVVESKLKKYINGVEVNCELHTKMKRLSSNPPDRIYFCPQLRRETGIDNEGKIFIYKITKHA